MIQAQLNLPKFDNKGKSTRRALNQLEVETCKKFGGLTTYTGKGKWLNKNKLYYDNLNIYQIYIKRNQTKLFINHAIKFGKLTKQLAVAIVINNKTIQELKDFLNNQTFFKSYGIKIKKSDLKLARKILEKKELTEEYLNKVVLKHGNFIIQ